MAINPVSFPSGPMVQKDGTLTHVWQRFFLDLWRKTGQAANTSPLASHGTLVLGNIPGNAQNIEGILSSLHLNSNGQLNTTNFCTVDSIDNGTNATIRVYGSGGVGTTWQRQVSNVMLGPYPSYQQSGFTYGASFEVFYRPSTNSYQAFAFPDEFPSTLDDELIWAGGVKTVSAGGGGGSTGGGGGTGGTGGCTEVGTPLYFDHGTESARMDVVQNAEWIDLRFTPQEQPLRVHPDTLVSVWVKAKDVKAGDLLDVNGDGSFLPVESVTPNTVESYKQVLKVTPSGAYRAGSRKVRLHNRKQGWDTSA